MKSKIIFILSMVIFGTIAIFVRHIHLASSSIALLRGILGSLFLLVIILGSKIKISWHAIYENIFLLICSGASLSFNWIFLFQAYRYTTISNAVLSYYFAPVFIMILSPLILKERLSIKKVLCIGVAIVGMFFIMTNQKNATGEYNHILGILYGLLAAGFYAALMFLNKFIKKQSGLETTFIQLSTASLLLLPYVLITEGFGILSMDRISMHNIIILGILHTGIAFYLFFTAIQKLEGQTIATLSYIDPLISLFISVLILKENMTMLQLIGGILLLGSTFVSERKLIHK